MLRSDGTRSGLTKPHRANIQSLQASATRIESIVSEQNCPPLPQAIELDARSPAKLVESTVDTLPDDLVSPLSLTGDVAVLPGGKKTKTLAVW